MQRRTFVKQLPAMELMTPALNASAISLITAKPEENAALFVGSIESDIGDCGQDAVIKVIGVGGGGCDAINFMIDQIDQKVLGVEFIAIDSDAQALTHNKAGTHLQIGAASELSLSGVDRARIANLINDADMVFIVAGMGGETGTRVASLAAKISHELNILTIAIVTKPSGCEERLMRCAVEGIRELRENADSLIVVPISGLMKIPCVAKPEVFLSSNGVMRDVVSCIADIVNYSGLIGVDFADVRTVMSEKGMSMIGTAVALGADRARFAAERAIVSPMFENMDLSGACGMLVNITSSSSLKLAEIDDVMECVQSVAKEALIIVGAIFDEAMGDAMRVTVVATGMHFLPNDIDRVVTDSCSTKQNAFLVP